MKIDNRILLPFVMPFALLALARLLWWAAGAPWSDPGAAAFLCAFFGLPCGVFAMVHLFEEKIEIGHLHIGNRK